MKFHLLAAHHSPPAGWPGTCLTIVRNLGFSSPYNEKTLEQPNNGGDFICLSAKNIPKI